jgi:dolichol-phosphate mannosyltransferase
MLAIVVVPTYNERDNIGPLVSAILAHGREFEVVIVDDSSPDGTGELADRLAASDRRVHVIHRPGKQGLGTAYVAGFAEALERGADAIFEMDADFSHDPRLLPEFLAQLDAADVVVGSRYAKGLAIVNWSLRRLVLSLAANRYARLITGLDLRDCTSGFKCFRRDVLESIDLGRVYSNGYAFQVEMNYRAHRLGYRLAEVPIVFFDRHAGQSKMSTRIAREAFLDILRMRVVSLLRPSSFARQAGDTGFATAGAPRGPSEPAERGV